MLAEMMRLIRERDLCVLATVEGDRPYCSLMAYAPSADGSELYLATLRATRKYRNLLANPAVSLLIDTRERRPREEALALTIEGECRAIEDPGRRAEACRRLAAAHPHLAALLARPETAILCVRPRSLLLLRGVHEAHYATLDPPAGTESSPSPTVTMPR